MLIWGGGEICKRPGTKYAQPAERTEKRPVWRGVTMRENRKMRGDRGNVVSGHVNPYRLL